MLNLANLVFRIVNAFKGFVNSIIFSIAKFSEVIMMLLPDSPFQSVLSNIEGSEIFETINWVIPFASFVSIGIAWTTAIAIFYVLSVALRFIKAIE